MSKKLRKIKKDITKAIRNRFEAGTLLPPDSPYIAEFLLKCEDEFTEQDHKIIKIVYDKALAEGVIKYEK